MIEVKQAVAAAVENFKSLYPEHSDLLLEEVDRSEDDKYWFITLGFAPVQSAQAANALSQLGAALRSSRRVYKVFKVAADTGEVLSMKIREALAA